MTLKNVEDLYSFQPVIPWADDRQRDIMAMALEAFCLMT
jgi:hypothetical protein